MIPSTNSQLLVTEDWKKIYQSFRNADFQSYDFETLRRTMISYLQENYPEDFNDYIDSSEYIALIDLIAYLGQNLSFRIDLNARENFLETAQRRDSILQLARLISYVPKRNTPASGLLKIMSVSTTDTVIDSNSINLANSTVVWNDVTNSNWYEQFLTILNSALQSGTSFGKPTDRATIENILTEQYKLNSANTDVPSYGFLKSVNGTNMNFEIVSSTFAEQPYIYEEAPSPGNAFGLIYQNDNRGSGSANTGFFTHFKQGTLGLSQFTISNPVPNEIVGINISNINDTDVWVWQLDANGGYSNLWTKTSSLVGNNVIYNSLNKDIRNFYSVTTRDRDQIDLNFADGSFGNLPKGQFSIFYRQSNGLTYSIKPEQLSGIIINVPYINSAGQGQTLTLTLSLQYTVTNSSGPESNASIQSKAPQAYYTQNRMVTAEDYNIAPLTLGNQILKVKSVARVTSGISKYFELSDVSGKYSSTNIFATDGIVYKDATEQNFQFTTGSRNSIFTAIKKYLEPVVSSTSLKSFYLDRENYFRPLLTTAPAEWVQITKSAGQCTGYFIDKTNTVTLPISVGEYASNNFSYVKVGALIKFVPPSGKYFLSNGTLVSNKTTKTFDYLWVNISQVTGDGSNYGVGLLETGSGPIVLSNSIDSTAIPVEVVPKFINVFSYAFELSLVDLCLSQRNFGLSFDQYYRNWNIITDSNLDLISNFSLVYQNNKDNANRDASWLMAFVWTGTNYKVRYRITDYIFESEKQTAFFIDSSSVNYDFTTDSTIKDQVNVLSINTSNTSTSVALGKDYQWQVDSAIIEEDGYINPKKVKVSFYNYNDLGLITDPDTFENIVSYNTVNSVTGYNDKFVYFQKQADGLRYKLIDSSMFTAYPTPADVTSSPNNGDLYYFYDPAYNVVNSYSTSTANISNPWIYDSNAASYFAYPGRDTIKFHYLHNSGQTSRIDPSKSNIIDVYLLTSDYDSSFRSWLYSGTGSAPLPPTSAALENNYSAKLEAIKTISDEMIFQPVSYNILFGSQASINLQATFKAVKNSSRTTSDNDIKARILTTINDFFALENWDFGQSFYFSELSAYVMNVMTPDITNFIIVSKSGNNFGSLYEVTCGSNEIFISGATVSDIEVIDAVTATQLNSTSIVTSSGY
jgi:hypothetical protein